MKGWRCSACSAVAVDSDVVETVANSVKHWNYVELLK